MDYYHTRRIFFISTSSSDSRSYLFLLRCFARNVNSRAGEWQRARRGVAVVRSVAYQFRYRGGYRTLVGWA